MFLHYYEHTHCVLFWVSFTCAAHNFSTENSPQQLCYFILKIAQLLLVLLLYVCSNSTHAFWIFKFMPLHCVVFKLRVLYDIQILATYVSEDKETKGGV